MYRIVLLSFIILINSTTYAVIPWPFEPFDSAQPIGNSYGEYQDYGGGAYLHPGIDILHPAGTPVYAVKSGWVKAVLTTAADLHWRVAIADCDGADSCDGWLYAHLDAQTIAVSEGDHVDSGQFLGNIVTWPNADFHHCHFVKIRNAGLTWTADWLFVGNPLDELVNAEDTTAPVILNVGPGAPFRFCKDNTNFFFPIGGPLNGNVDIVAEALDRVGHPTWMLSPYAMGYDIYSDSVHLGPYTSFVFSGLLQWDQVQHVIYKNSGPCNSAGDYDQRVFYEILTNHDDDSLVELSDTTGKWATGQAPNDTYRVRVWARDQHGNTAWDSMTVATANFYDIGGTVTTSDDCPVNSGSLVTVTLSGAQASTAVDGSFGIASQPAGRYRIIASREGYQTCSEIYEVLSPRNLSIMLEPAPYVNGDVDNSGNVDISDAVYLIQFIFNDGPAPKPWSAAMQIDGDPAVDISDVVYLIGYIFGGGPPPEGR